MGVSASVSLFAAAVVCLYPAAVLAADQRTDAWQNVDEHRRVSASDDARYQDEGKQIKLESGGIMIENLDDRSVATELGSVEPRKRSLAFIRYRQGCEHVFALLGPTTIRVHGRATTINAGEEAIIANHEPTYEGLLGADYIGRRRLRMNKLPEGESLGLAEFSLVHAVEREPVLYRLLHSQDPHDKALRDRLIKTAAILNYVTAGHGQYVTGRR